MPPEYPFQIADRRPIKVKLTTDLTQYHPKLTKGSVGHTQFKRALWGLWVTFDKAGRWDILSKSLQIIDKEYNAAQKYWDKIDKQKENQPCRVQQATNITSGKPNAKTSRNG